MRFVIFALVSVIIFSACSSIDPTLSDAEDVPLGSETALSETTVDTASQSVEEPTVQATPVVPTATATMMPTNTPVPAPTDCAYRQGWQIYVIQSGDTLWELAEATGSTIDTLKQANCLTDDVLTVGYRLIVPRQPSTDEESD